MKKIIFIALIACAFMMACGNRQKTNNGMKEFRKVSIERINISAPKLISNWMLITAGRDTTAFNTMTASWGSMGYLWEKNVAIVFIRPQRYTKEFVDANSIFTLSFYDDAYREALTICGTKSGRNTNKVQEAGLTPMATPEGSVAFAEANMIFECRKLYAAPIDSAAFIDTAIVNKLYPNRDFHTVYIGEILNAYRK
ncbi:MAG: flavin reductase [Prevotellaceae bacterium]|jgi:flavin reductase (DIM6/NTAB) family NADH-FMN oxidoreductase RutF|nr:flavin reductase [Prevotellaceae bacterium]